MPTSSRKARPQLVKKEDTFAGLNLWLTWKPAAIRTKSLMKSGRSGRIRTCDPCVPNAVLYRAEPHSDKNAAYSLGFRTPQEGELRTLTPLNVGLKTQI